MVWDYPEPKEGQDPLYDGDTGVRCAKCDQPIYDGEWAGEDDQGRYVCHDCIIAEFEGLSKEEQICFMHYDAVKLNKPTRVLHSR